MRVKVLALTVMTGACLAMYLSAGLVSAHHANSAYDRSREITVTGTVTRWQFINPHAGIWLEVTDEQGNVNEWSGEMQSIQDLYRHYGWNKNTFKPGDEVTIIGAPDRRSGRYSVWTSKVVFPDGTEVDLRTTPDDPRTSEQTP